VTPVPPATGPLLGLIKVTVGGGFCAQARPTKIAMVVARRISETSKAFLNKDKIDSFKLYF
jgi:hypothetical protein